MASTYPQRLAKARAARQVPPRKGWLTVAQLVKQFGSTPRAWQGLLATGEVHSDRVHGLLWADPASARHYVAVWSKQPRGRGRPRTLRLPRGK